jgi:hypothetical protein
MSEHEAVVMIGNETPRRRSLWLTGVFGVQRGGNIIGAFFGSPLIRRGIANIYR